MALSDFEVFQDYSYKAATETLQQNVELFNEASNGAITLTSAANVGDFANNGSFAEVAGMMRRRNAYGTGSVSPVPLGMINQSSVKIAGGTVPVEFEPSQFAWLQMNPEQAGVQVGEQLAKGMLADQLNAAITALVAAVTNNADAVYDGTAGTLDLPALLKGAAKMGDQSASLAAWVLHSSAAHDLMADNLANSSNLFAFGSVNVMQDGFGRKLLITDSPALKYDDTGDRFSSLGLVQGAASVEDNGDLYSNLQTSNGSENVVRTMQSEYSFNLGVRGYSFTGSKSPTDAQLGTGASWDQVASDIKSTAGVVVQTK